MKITKRNIKEMNKRVSYIKTIDIKSLRSGSIRVNKSNTLTNKTLNKTI